MKTTVDIPDALLDAANRAAAEEGTTVRALIESGLRHVLEQRKRPLTFRLPKASFKGKGLQAGVSDAAWQTIRELSYTKRS